MDIYKFALTVLQTMGVRLIVIVLGALNHVILARLLGPSMRGSYAVGVTFGDSIVQISNLGISATNTYAIAHDKERVSYQIGSSIIALVVITFVIFLSSLLVPDYIYAYLYLDKHYINLIFVYSVLSISYMFFQSIAIGYGEIKYYNIIEIFFRCFCIFFILVLYFIEGASLEIAFYSIIISIALSIILYVLFFSLKLKMSVNFSFDIFISNLPYTVKSYFGSISAFLLQRMDILVLGSLVSAESIGLYSVAISIISMIEGVSGTLSQLLLPKLIEIKNIQQKKVFFRKIVFANLFLFISICFLLFSFSYQIVIILFGNKYLGSANILVYLLPGVFFRSFTNIYGSLIGSINIPRSGALFGFLMCIITYIMITEFVPIFGIIAASVTYSVVSFLFVPYVLYYAYRIFHDDKVYVW